MTITSRERFKAIARFQRPGDLSTHDILWGETLREWVEQGAPSQLTDRAYFGRFFGYDYMRSLHEVVSWLVILPYAVGDITTFLSLPPIVPRFEPKILEQEENTVIVMNPGGQTVRILRNDPQKMPMYLDQPVRDRETWREYKKRLDPDTPERWPADWESYVDKMNSRDIPVILGVGSFFGFLREWMGLERVLYTFHDDPDLISDMMDTVLHLELEVIKRTVKDIKVDQASFWEDMCYKAGPLISPGMFRKFMMPRYKQITELLRKNGIDIIFVDSDGNVEQLVPLWLECGINYVWPFEVAAGNDAVAIRKKYGRELIIGGTIDKRSLAKGKEAIREEVLSKVPFLLEQGGYFPTVDHAVPPDVTFESYCYYINLMREVAGLEKLSFQKHLSEAWPAGR